MKTSHKAVFLMILCTLFTSLGQILWKLGVIRIDLSNIFSVFNLPFMMGFVAYGVGWIFMLMSFKRGELSILYPIVATSYIWVSIFSPIIFPTDSMNLLKWVGVIVILISVSILGFGGSNEKKVMHHG
jgi:multidrug transporter EmrE-like cation transporter